MTTSEQADPAAFRLAPSAYYAESLVSCGLQQAWNTLMDYEAWNPSFVDAQVVLVSGNPRAEGGVVLIKKNRKDITGAPLPEFYAETVRVVPLQQIVWYCYPKQGNSFRNFVDFRLAVAPPSVRFSIHYYAQDQLRGDLLTRQKSEYQEFLGQLAVAFKRYCEGHG